MHENTDQQVKAARFYNSETSLIYGFHSKTFGTETLTNWMAMIKNAFDSESSQTYGFDTETTSTLITQTTSPTDWHSFGGAINAVSVTFSTWAHVTSALSVSDIYHYSDPTTYKLEMTL